MRLVNVHTLVLHEFTDTDVPPYAIAFHTWSAEETSYEDVKERRNTSTKGHEKLRKFAEYVVRWILDIEWLWLDTCCIDKANHLELTEAVESMYKWFQNAAVCLVHLADVTEAGNEDQFAQARWFTRGWTLQELIASPTVVFMTAGWQTIGHKGRKTYIGGHGIRTLDHRGPNLESLIAKTTGIPETVLRDPRRLESVSILERMNWASRRMTTQEEDKVYILLGLLGVFMPMVYGEGLYCACKRLESLLPEKWPRKIPDTSLNLLNRCNPDYIWEEKVTELLNFKLSKPGARTALVGLVGIGKTETAAQYACDLLGKSSIARAIWIDASSEAKFDASVQAVVSDFIPQYSQVLHGDIFETISRCLQDQMMGRWLVILDDVADASFLLEKPNGRPSKDRRRRIDYIPKCSYGSVLVTTRSLNEAAKLLGHNDMILLDRMDEEAATSLLKVRIGSVVDDEDISELAFELGFNPLAITQAADYIRVNWCSARQYIEYFRKVMEKPGRAFSEQSLKENIEGFLEGFHSGKGARRGQSINSTDSPAMSRTSSASSLDSMWSQASVVSSVSSVGATLLSDSTVDYFVSSLFCTLDLAFIHSLAISERSIGEEKYYRALRRTIFRYGKALRSELGSGKSLDTARLLQSRHVSARTARAIIEKIGSRDEIPSDGVNAPGAHVSQEVPSQPQEHEHDTQNELPDDASDTSSEEDDAEAPDVDVDVDNIEDQVIMESMRDSLAFLQFKAELLEFAHRPYLKRLQRALKSDPEFVADSRAEVAMSIVHEISWTPPHIFRFHDREEVGILDHLKAWLEDRTGDTWLWWPLAPCRRPVKPGEMRIKWNTPCGSARSIDLPNSIALAWKTATATAPAFLSLDSVLVEASNTAPTTSTANPGPDSSAPHSSSSANTQTADSGALQTRVNQPDPSRQIQNVTSSMARGAHGLGTQPQVPPREPRFVYLCVKKGNRRYMAKLKIHKYITDAKVFSALKRKYLDKKGIIRRFLSCWQYSHCQFYQFSKYPNGAAPSIIGFPPDGDIQYDFIKPITPRPSPQLPVGPITQEEFRDRFYNFCEDCSHLWHREQMRRWRLSLTDQDRIQVLPKRKAALQWEDCKAEAFWGLKVCEAISGFRVTVYMVVFNVPAVVFFFLWLFEWKHPSDLQDASVPFFTSITLTFGFVSWITRNRQGDVDD